MESIQEHSEIVRGIEERSGFIGDIKEYVELYDTYGVSDVPAITRGWHAMHNLMMEDPHMDDERLYAAFLRNARANCVANKALTGTFAHLCVSAAIAEHNRWISLMMVDPPATTDRSTVDRPPVDELIRHIVGNTGLRARMWKDSVSSAWSKPTTIVYYWGELLERCYRSISGTTSVFYTGDQSETKAGMIITAIRKAKAAGF